MAQKSFNVIVDTSSCKEQPTSAPQINQLLAKGECLPSNTHGMQQGTSPTQMIYHLLWPKGKEYGSPILNGITCRFPIGLVRCNCPLLPLLLAPTLNPAQCTWEGSDKQLPNLTQMRGEVWRAEYESWPIPAYEQHLQGGFHFSQHVTQHILWCHFAQTYDQQRTSAARTTWQVHNDNSSLFSTR